ncbi:MAG: GAF domain-containing SpoIIE family protein phosphatase [Patescibacteria group bacterium]|nr:GAF domain-containing SpoIIE family protein phosphatase [Patescibacteria group bacterium]
MADPASHYLRVFPDLSALPGETPVPRVPVGSLAAVLRAFQQATGWELKYLPAELVTASQAELPAPVPPGNGTSPGQLRLAADPPRVEGQTSAIGRKAAQALASSVSDMLGELLHTQHSLWQREAELAAGVPVVPHADEQGHLAERLEAVLKGGAEAVGCQAAALYLLDDATTQLKLRSCWGLPLDRLTDPPRRLKGSIADLEAMLGHAVVLDDRVSLVHWNPPEDFPAAVCVPVSSPTTILGTLWFFADRQRDFTAHETNILEVVAGRIAADLEREMLWREGVDGARLKRQLAAVERIQRGQLPSVSPLLDGWDLAGWTWQAESVGGDFFDWFGLPGGLVAVAVGDALERGLEAAFAATALKAALRAHAPYHREAQETLEKLNLSLWTGSAGDQYASMFLGLIETATGRISCASAGRPWAIRLHATGWESIEEPGPRLGESPESVFEPFGCELAAGEVLLLMTDGMRATTDAAGRPLGPAGIAELLLPKLHLSADQLARVVRDAISPRPGHSETDDRTLLVIRRTPT